MEITLTCSPLKPNLPVDVVSKDLTKSPVFTKIWDYSININRESTVFIVERVPCSDEFGVFADVFAVTL